MKKFSITICVVLVVVLGYWYYPKHAQAPIAQPVHEKAEPITITAVGDIMLDRGVRRSVEKNFANDYSALFEHADYLKESDITFGNLEGTITDDISPRTGSRFSFRMNPIALPALKDAGFDVLSFANNHVGDYSLKGFTESLRNILESKILATGAGQNYTEVTTPVVITVRGVRIGFLGATDIGPDWLAAKPDRPGILLASDPHLPEIVRTAKQSVDVLVVSLHFGTEYSPANQRQEELAHILIDNGADIILGSHPHVMERVEEYGGGIIYYSLGNYIFDQYFSSHTMEGMVAHISYDPETKQLTHSEEVSELSKQYVPSLLRPFSDTDLITKRFTP